MRIQHVRNLMPPEYGSGRSAIEGFIAANERRTKDSMLPIIGTPLNRIGRCHNSAYVEFGGGVLVRLDCVGDVVDAFVHDQSSSKIEDTSEPVRLVFRTYGIVWDVEELGRQFRGRECNEVVWTENSVIFYFDGGRKLRFRPVQRVEDDACFVFVGEFA